MKQRVRFVDAPPPIGGPQDPRSIWFDRLAFLLERPGEWAEVYTGTPSGCHQAAGALRTRQYHVPPGDWDFTVRSFRRGHLAFHRDAHSMAAIYARYNGTDGGPPNRYAAWHLAADAVWDTFGRRLCPVCERNALIRDAGRYPLMCDKCGEDMAAGIDAEHGTEQTYMKKGCRCRPCRDARYTAEIKRGHAKGARRSL